MTQLTAKKVERIYKRHKIVIQYSPSDKEWNYSIIKNVKLQSYNTVKTFDAALRSAKSRIDGMTLSQLKIGMSEE